MARADVLVGGTARCGRVPVPIRHNPRMLAAGQAVAVIAALIHAWIFLLESVWFRRPRVWARFGLRSEDEARIVRGFAFNQGFYNLFLSIGAGLGVALMLGSGGATGDATLFAAGRAVALFACGSMAAAGVVLIATDRRFLRAAALQVLPGLGAVALLVLG
jgi:putative membrane protein